LHPAHTVTQSAHQDLYIEFYVGEGPEISILTRCPRGEPFVGKPGECISLRSG
jgi:hypothetical protein